MITFNDLASKKVKLKFGDKEQIECIDREAGFQKEDKEALSLYKAIVYYSGEAEIEIEAVDEYEAREKVQEETHDLDIEWTGVEHIDVELIKEHVA